MTWIWCDHIYIKWLQYTEWPLCVIYWKKMECIDWAFSFECLCWCVWLCVQGHPLPGCPHVLIKLVKHHPLPRQPKTWFSFPVLLPSLSSHIFIFFISDTCFSVCYCILWFLQLQIALFTDMYQCSLLYVVRMPVCAVSRALCCSLRQSDQC